jgi:hypothetical protein
LFSPAIYDCSSEQWHIYTALIENAQQARAYLYYPNVCKRKYNKKLIGSNKKKPSYNSNIQRFISGPTWA